MSNNKQQTIVQWIRHQIKQQGGSHYFTTMEILDRAEQMEKEQAIKLYYEYELYVMMNESDVMMNESNVMTFGQFYKQTYGGNK